MNNKGFSIIELIVAVAIFVIIAGSATIAALGSFMTTRLAREETQATVIATEGLEAVQSIRNQDWNNLINGNYGLSSVGNIWNFSGSSDVTDKFTRVITVSNVERDANGNIVVSGGVVDTETKYITSTVTWNFTPARLNTVDVAMYLANWQMSRGSGGATAPIFTTCTEYCLSVGYVNGTCRASSQLCTNNNEDYKPAGESYCSGTASDHICCCLP